MKSEINAEKANQIIAEFMEHKSCYDCKHHVEDPQPGGLSSHYSCENVEDGFYAGDACPNFEPESFPQYSKSLDALVPVWEKLGFENFCFLGCSDKTFLFRLNLQDLTSDGCGKTIQEAASIATAKAIREVGGE